jgi:hypothetical protein
MNRVLENPILQSNLLESYYPGEEPMNVIFRKICSTLILAIVLLVPAAAWTDENNVTPDEPTLIKAVMCESIQKFTPINEAVVFSIDLGRIYSFTEFDPVPKQTVIYHKWYHRGRLVSVKQLTINPPRWSSFSSMQLRDADKGPWRVDIVDDNDKLLRTLMFSITD